jgi:AraC-like DNA-binding protein
MQLNKWLMLGLWLVGAHLLKAQQSFIPYMERVNIDGRVNEWNLKHPLISFFQDNLVRSNTNSIKISAGWNETHLYILFYVEDNNLIQLTTDSSKAYLNDAVEFYIDPFLDSREKMDVNDYQFIVNLNNQVSILKGDYRKTDSLDIAAPKEHGITTLVFKSATHLMGSLNNPAADTGYVVEMSIPLAAVGIEPREGIRAKMDFCINDADSLVDIVPIPDSAEVPGFYYSSWKGSRNFSFPSEWSVFELKGKPSWLTRFVKTNTRLILWGGIAIVVISALIIGWLIIRIRQLKNVPQKSALPQFNEIQRYMQEEPQPLDLQQPEVADNPPAELTETPAHTTELKAPKEEPLVIKKARNYILANIENEIELEKLSSSCAVSSRQLQRIFKEYLNITPSNFIVILKMEAAEDLLKKGDKNVTEIAYHLGYSDPAYFTRVFKKYFGFPPSQILG